MGKEFSLSDEDIRRKISVSNTGKIRSLQSRENYRIAALLRDDANRIAAIQSSEFREKIRASSKGRIHSKETRRKMSNSMTGLKRSTVGCFNIGQAARQRTRKECPYCGKILDPVNYERWHNNNCKQRIPQ
jgi:hypothetical protein